MNNNTNQIQALEQSRERILNILTVESNPKAIANAKYRILKINDQINNLK